MKTYPERGVHGHIVHVLGADIVNGLVEPGSQLIPEVLGEKFNASRTVVREALKVLASKGLVDSAPKRGTFVTPSKSWNRLDPDFINWRFNSLPERATMEGISEARLALEPFAARLAALRRTEEDINNLGEALLKMAQAVRAGSLDPELFTESDLKFHRALFEATKNEILASFSQIMQSGLASRDKLVHSKEKFSETSERAHRKVFEAIIAGDPDLAEKRMRSLLLDAAKDEQEALGL